MKNKFLAANWKSNKTKFEAKDWLVEISNYEVPTGLEVVIFPPFTLLDIISGYVKVNSMPFKIGAQDISPFDSGAFTGEISAAQIKEFADYVLIGHSERRTNFAEDNEIVRKKVEKAVAIGLIPVVCVSTLDQADNLKSDKIIFAYEPIGAIGTGKPAEPNSVEEIAKQIKNINNQKVIYGGSVNAENIDKYLNLFSVDGVLVGSDSLDPKSFANIIKNAI